jgi:gamma-glutamylcyclotransferase (GGCT)/AIG2-like uncharacterized protein YtfP
MRLRQLINERGENPTYYFAYGMLTDPDNMPGATYLGQAELRNYRMEFWHWADVVPSAGDVVYGALWTLPDGMLKKLDNTEGYPDLYGRKVVPVFYKNKRIEAIVYYMTPQTHEMIRDRQPSKRYLQTMMSGYVNSGIPGKQIHQALKSSL